MPLSESVIRQVRFAGLTGAALDSRWLGMTVGEVSAETGIPGGVIEAVCKRWGVALSAGYAIRGSCDEVRMRK